MGFGHGAVSVVTLILVVASIVYLSRTGIDQPEEALPAGPGAQAGYSQPQYAQSSYTQPQYGQPRYYGDPRRGDPRYGAEPGYEDPRYRDQRDYRNGG
jgi:hypothetical protein